MDDHRPEAEAEAKMRQPLGLPDAAKSSAADDSQHLARQVIRSQAAAREYAERHLARAEQAIQDLQTKLHTVRREEAIALESARAAHEAQAQAERARRIAEVALWDRCLVRASILRKPGNGGQSKTPNLSTPRGRTPIEGPVPMPIDS